MSSPASPAERPPATQSLIGPRVMIITDQTDLGRALEQHISIIWPGAKCRVHSPLQSGRLHSGFTAIGYDAVMLDDQVERGRGEEWLENLMHRPMFPPVLYLARGDDPACAVRVVERGAVDCLVRERIDHTRMAAALRDALLQRREQVTSWTGSPEALQASRFGSVTILGHRFVRELASGGTSLVYLAESERAGDMVVLKVLRESEDGDVRVRFARFMREYELISKIRHPNVAPVFDLGVAEDHAYIAMEYFPRGDLRAHIARGMQPRVAAANLAQMAAALQAVHGVGVLHRDLKPGNIMLRVDGSLAIIDFGLAKLVDVALDITGTGEIFGTPYYMSPEQGHGKELDERSDLYSLGVIFYEMLTCAKPFVAPTPMGVVYMHGNSPIPRLKGELKMYQPLIERLLAKDPADRYASASDLLSALGPYLQVSASE